MGPPTYHDMRVPFLWHPLKRTVVQSAWLAECTTVLFMLSLGSWLVVRVVCVLGFSHQMGVPREDKQKHGHATGQKQAPPVACSGAGRAEQQ